MKCFGASMFGALAMAWALSGCDQIAANPRDKARKAADEALRAKKYHAAAAALEGVLDGTATTAEVHYELGLLYEDKLDDPVGALHHFGRYLAYDPKGSRAGDARRLCAELEPRIVSGMAAGGRITQQEAVRLKNENLALRKQVAELRDRAKAPEPAVPVKGKPVEARQRPVAPGARTYTVQQGDTLASIARRFYKDTARWKDIQDANFYGLQGTANIKPGQVLMIPE